MNARTTIKLLAFVCLAEAVFIGFLSWRKVAGAVESLSAKSVAVAPALEQPSTPKPVTAPVAATAKTPADLAKENVALATELAEVKKELDARKSEISFSYGSIRDSGRFVGMTFRKMFETAEAREASEAEARRADNQINVLSLGPFIQDAEVMESDPGAFAQFQAPLISEVLGLPREQESAVETLLEDYKTKSLKLEMDSPEWAELNEAALQKITALLADDQKPGRKAQLDFLKKYGVLLIPAYSILRAPTPTVVEPAPSAH